MTFFRGLLAARSHLAFLFGLSGALATIAVLDVKVLGRSPETIAPLLPAVPPAPAVPVITASEMPLTDGDRAWARSAWQHFERERVDRVSPKTLTETGSYLMGLVAAYQLGLIDRAAFDRRIDRALDSLALETMLFRARGPTARQERMN